MDGREEGKGALAKAEMRLEMVPGSQSVRVSSERVPVVTQVWPQPGPKEKRGKSNGRNLKSNGETVPSEIMDKCGIGFLGGGGMGCGEKDDSKPFLVEENV